MTRGSILLLAAFVPASCTSWDAARGSPSAPPRVEPELPAEAAGPAVPSTRQELVVETLHGSRTRPQQDLDYTAFKLAFLLDQLGVGAP